MKTILITGISSGLGRAIFDRLCSQQVNLICISRRYLPYQLELEQKRTNIQLIEGDLSEQESIESSILHITEDWNAIKNFVFINNAGTVEPIDCIGDLQTCKITESININFLAPVLITNYLVNKSKVYGFKLRIINISSGAANHPIAGWAIYSSTKAAAKMFFDVLCKQDEIVYSNCIINFDPGVMDTKMQAEIRKANKDVFPRLEEFIELCDTGKLSSPEVIAEIIIKEYLSL